MKEPYTKVMMMLLLPCRITNVNGFIFTSVSPKAAKAHRMVDHYVLTLLLQVAMTS